MGAHVSEDAHAQTDVQRPEVPFRSIPQVPSTLSFGKECLTGLGVARGAKRAGQQAPETGLLPPFQS